MNDRLMIAAMAMQGLCSDNTIVGRAGKTFAEVVSSMALELADALLAAAGEKEDHRIEILARELDLAHNARDGHYEARIAAESKLAACEMERAQLSTYKNAEMSKSERLERAFRESEREVALLKRRLEPLTLQEGGGVNNPIIYGSRPLAWDEITAIVADADRIRSRRQP